MIGFRNVLNGLLISYIASHVMVLNSLMSLSHPSFTAVSECALSIDAMSLSFVYYDMTQNLVYSTSVIFLCYLG